MTAPKRQRNRKWTMILGGIGLVPLLILLLLPVWFPWVLRPVLSQQGIVFEQCERVGMHRFRLEGVRGRFSGLLFEAQTLETCLPTGLIWNRYVGNGRPARPSLFLKNWRLEIEEPGSTEATSPVALAEVFDQVQLWGLRIGDWLPRIEALDGDVELLGTTWSVSRVNGEGKQVRLEARSTFLPGDGSTTLELKIGESLEVVASLPNPAPALEMKLTPVGTEWNAEGKVVLGSDELTVNARWGEGGLVPETARLGGHGIGLPVDLFPELPIESALADLLLDWENGRWNGSVGAELGLAEPIAAEWGTVQVQLGGFGTFTGATLTRLEAQAKAGDLRLEAPLDLLFASPWLGKPATFSLESDLASVALLSATGKLSGQLKVVPGPALVPRVDYELQLDEASLLGGSVRSFSATVAGALAWPELELAELKATVATGGSLLVHGQADLLEKSVRGVELSYSGAVPYDLAAVGVRLAEVQLKANMGGVWPNLLHQGTARLHDLGAAGIDFDSVSLDWEGSGLDLRLWNLVMQRDEASLTASGETRVEEEGTLIRTQLHTLDWKNDLETRFSLARPFDLSFGLPAEERKPFIRCSPWEWQGTEGARLALQADVEWPTRGSWRAELQALDISLVRDFLDVTLPAIRVEGMVMAGEWDGGAIAASTQISASHRIPELPEAVALDGFAHLGADGLTLDRFNLGFGKAGLLTLKGQLPIRVEPTRATGMLVIDEAAPLELGLESARSDLLGAWLSEVLPLQVEEPRVSLVVTGTVARPTAWASVNAAKVRLSLGPETERVPDVEQLAIKVRAELDKLEVVEGGFRILDQPGMVTGKFDLEAQNLVEWFQLVSHPDWERFSGRVELKDAEISALAQLASDVVMPRGKVSVEVGIAPGLNLQGRCQISGINIRPMPPFSSLYDVNADIELEEDTAHLRSAEALYGGQPVRLSGFLQRNGDELPWFDLSVKGEDLSVVRNEGIFVRADVDLRISHLTNSTPRVAGVISLRDSLLFKDIRSLLDIDLTQPTRRPPFFSVTIPPFADWLLDIRVHGDRFMRVRSPVFRGEVSMGMALIGTLAKPIAVGDVTVPSGQIVFPFGLLDLDRGRVNLTEADPYRPQIDVQASAYNFGYLVRLDLTGTQERPDLMLNSVPPLTPKEIILMLTAGEVPDQRISYSSTDKASRIGLYLGKELLNQFLGSGQSASRLTIRTGEHVADDGSVTYAVEYKLTERWSAIGEYSRFKDINTGLKFKIFSR